MESYNFPYVVPQLVEDNSLKRARTTITEGGEEKEAIRVTSVGGSGGLDSQGVADAMGKKPTTITTGSVVNHLDNINFSTGSTDYAVGSRGDATWPGEGSGSLIAIAKLAALDADSAAMGIGHQSDGTWPGSGDGTLVSIGKRAAEVLGTTSDASVSTDYNGTISGRIKHISGSAYNTRIKTEVIAANFGTTTASPWTGSGGATLIAINKRTSNDTNATATATGTQSDAAWSGTGDGTVIALLKGIYNKL